MKKISNSRTSNDPLTDKSDFEKFQLPYTEHQLNWLRNNLPVIVQPEHDIKNGYGLIAVFVWFETTEARHAIMNRSGQHVKCHLKIVYEGEANYNRRDPMKLNRFGTFLYRSFNYLSFKRTADINQLCIEGIDFEADQPWSFISTEDYCGMQSWSKGVKLDCCLFYSLIYHYDLEAPFNDWTKMQDSKSRPVVYLNTANHLQAPFDNNPNIKKRHWEYYPVYAGNHTTAELFAKTVVAHKCNLLTCFRYPKCCVCKSLKPPYLDRNEFNKLPVWPNDYE